jgi:lipopolysaccharide cholinephosphotransferase
MILEHISEVGKMIQSEFNRLQETQIEIMDEIHQICVENDIVYYIIGGTALGAVRHKGFIPWDLDMDIAMPRKDYEKFKRICKEKMNPRFKYRDFLNTANFSHPHALVCINNTILVNRFDKFNPGLENIGIYLDVFPLDNAPDNSSLRDYQMKQLKKIKRIKKNKLAFCYNSSRIKKIMKKLISFCYCWISVESINRKMDIIMQKYNNKETTCLCSMASRYSYLKQCIPIEVYGTPTEVLFENRKYFAPQQLEKYLSRIYGDYMKLPPIEEQRVNLNVFEKVTFDK